MPTTRDGVEVTNHQERLREVIPHYIRDGVLRRVGLPDGGIQFVEAMTDRVFATIDGQGRFVA